MQKVALHLTAFRGDLSLWLPENQNPVSLCHSGIHLPIRISFIAIATKEDGTDYFAPLCRWQRQATDSRTLSLNQVHVYSAAGTKQKTLELQLFGDYFHS